MSIKNKTILLVSIVILILSGFNFYQGLKNANEILKSKIQGAELQFDEVVNDLVINTFAPYSSRIITFANVHPEIVKAFAQRDRESLFRLALPYYQNLKRENPYFHTMPFVIPEGRMFLRLHQPDYYDDDLRTVRPIFEAVHRSQVQLTGFEIGRLGAYYRTVQPLFYRDKYIGAFEFGVRVEQLVSNLQKKLKGAVAPYYFAEKWEKATKRQDFQKKLGRYTVLTSEKSGFSLLPDSVSLDIPHQEVELGGQAFIVHAHPVLKNYLGEVIGGFVALQDITMEKQQKRQFIINSVLFSGGLLVLAIFSLYVSFGSLIGKLEEARLRQDELLAELKDQVETQEATEQELREYKENLEKMVSERTLRLEKALAEVKTLSGLLPICASCKKIRDDQGFWKQVEVYVGAHSEAEFSHSICPDCSKKLYPDLYGEEES